MPRPKVWPPLPDEGGDGAQGSQKRGLNGFALLTPTQSSIQEDLYNQVGKVVWSQRTQI